MKAGLPKSAGVILVTVNYRVGPLDFLAHPELSAESSHHVSGNYALLDAIAALQWVKRNVSAFDGDPKKVTIFGQSAGQSAHQLADDFAASSRTFLCRDSRK
jgi:carboxylesterase type B